MAVETGEAWRSEADAPASAPRRVGHALRRGWRGFSRYFFSSLTRRIVTLNLVALFALVSAILYLNQFREGLIEARVQSLLTQGQIIAAAIAASATVDTGAITLDPDRLLELEAGESIAPFDETQTLEFPINPEKVAPILRRLISPTNTRARIYDSEGQLILDSRNLYARGDILRFDLPPLEAEPPGFFSRLWQGFLTRIWRGEMPVYEELGPESGLGYPEVATALQGSSASVVRVNERGELVVSAAVPVQRFRAVLGTLMLSTRGGDIDAILRAERLGILRIFLVAASVTVLLSVLLAGTIAGPVRRLAAGAERVRHSIRDREQIPDFSDRSDEIGHLSKALRDMTNALYNRLDSIESFAADVSHELKNPLTSLRSAVETLPLARNETDRSRLLAIVQHDVRRLDRLISDISDASRLDAELARADAEPVDLARLLRTVTGLANELRKEGQAAVALVIESSATKSNFIAFGRDSRLGQVITNLLDNARSFSPPDALVRVSMRRVGREIEIAVEDEGPGIPPDNLERIFERFYTDRIGPDSFGNNSGLGLSISKQIVEAYGGRLWAENRPFPPGVDPDARERRFGAGARFVVRLPRAG
jgi:two-component system sensor histidine kinase ChvG